MSQIRPLADKLLIKIIDDTQQTQGGIFIPDSAKEKPQKGEVIAAGPGAMNKEGKREELEVKVGDTVLFAKYAGTDVKVADETLKILSVSDVLGVIE